MKIKDPMTFVTLHRMNLLQSPSMHLLLKSLFSSLPTEKREELACIRHENWFVTSVANQQLKLLFYHYFVLLKIINVSRMLPSKNTFN